MERLNINNTSWENNIYSNRSFNFSNSFNQTHPYSNESYYHDSIFGDRILNCLNWVTIGIGLPLTLIVIIAVFSQVKKDHGAPVYVINLLICDLIQFCCRILMGLNIILGRIFFLVLIFSLTASVGFMVCISFERYLVIAWPLWYRFRRNIKTSVKVCAVVWIVLGLLVMLNCFLINFFFLRYSYILIGFLLLPVPLFIFCLFGTIKALSGALSVPADEKRRIVAIQAVVLLIYTLLFLPIIISSLFNEFNVFLSYMFWVCIFLSPLADTTLYLFIRKSIMDKFLAALCSCKKSPTQLGDEQQGL